MGVVADCCSFSLNLTMSRLRRAGPRGGLSDLASFEHAVPSARLLQWYQACCDRDCRRNIARLSRRRGHARRHRGAQFCPHPRARRSGDLHHAARRGRRARRSEGARARRQQGAAALRHSGRGQGQYRRQGLPTTAACPAFLYRPARDATAVARLREAGALILGKTNLDQFATGLVGVRTPYGIARNLFDPKLIPGGSSTGSAIAVGAGFAAACARHRHRRIGPRAGRLQQYCRAQAEPRHGLDRRRRSRLPHARLRVGLRAHRRRRDGGAQRDRRAGCGRSIFAVAAAARDAGPMPDGVRLGVPTTGPAPVLRRSGFGRGLRRGAGALCRPRRKNRRDRHRAVLCGGAAAL